MANVSQHKMMLAEDKIIHCNEILISQKAMCADNLAFLPFNCNLYWIYNCYNMEN